ncbi:F0F1 ATP synthase subunit A [Kineococcus sp. T90]|nr:F0F1 ATP synthase subunit A [Kineococcus indalonis]
MFVMALSVVVIGALLLATTKRLTVVPANKKQFAVEALYGFVRNGVARDIIGSKEFLRYVPLLFTMFVLILVNNLAGVIPPIQFPTMSRIGFPIALTLVVFVLYHAIGIKRKGLGGYFKSLMPAGVPVFLVPVVYLLELFTYFVSRPLTLAVRLFANMFAGHMLILVLFLGGEHLLLHGEGLLPAAGVVSYLFGLVMSFFELLIQVLQSYIFVLLTATYIAGSLADEH